MKLHGLALMAIYQIHTYTQILLSTQYHQLLLTALWYHTSYKVNFLPEGDLFMFIDIICTLCH